MMKTEKRILSLLFCVLMLVTLLPQLRLPVSADRGIEYWGGSTPDTFLPGTVIPDTVLPDIIDPVEGSCGESVSWKLSETGILTVTGTGPMADYAVASNIPWYSNRSYIRAVEIGEGVTTIGDRAFYGCTALETVTIGEDVTTIGSYAFRGCTLLMTVTLPENVTMLESSAFRACTALKTVRLEGNAPATENYVFNDIGSAITIEYFEGSTGYNAAPWNEFTHTTMHTGTWNILTAATCTTPGTRELWCTYCQRTITETYVLGHRYSNGVCTVCDHVKVLDSGNCGIESYWGASVYYDNVNWQLDVFGTLTISGCGEMGPFYMDHYPWYEHRQLITNAVIQSGVTSIGYGAFRDCSSLTSVTIPESVTSIGGYAFSDCSSLTSITIPDSVTSIEDYTFQNCSSLSSITIPESVTSIGCYAFSGCSSLTSITIPEGVTSIGCYAFSGCSSLTSVTIPDSVTRIDACTFQNCSSLSSITIPESVTSIGDSAFSGCSSLTSITIPEGVTSIGWYAFAGCSSLTSVTIPDSVTRIDACTFQNCSSLTSITIPDSVTSIEDYAFAWCSSLTSITIPESVTSIGSSAFAWCRRLTSITIPESVTSIGENAFYVCSNLASITFLGSAPFLGSYCFDGITATAYYPCGDESWTDEAKQNSGGNITWQANHSLGDDSTMQEATCTEDARVSGTCLICNDTVTNVFPGTATGHTYGDDGFCTVCGIGPDIIINMTDSYGDSWNGAAINVYADGVLLTTATVSDSYSQAIVPCHRDKTYTFQWVSGNCDSECSFEITMNGDVLFSGKGTDVGGTFYTLGDVCIHQYEAVITPPTCTEAGYTTYSCTLCDYSYTDEETSSLGHSYGGWKLEIIPDCTGYGLIVQTCSHCGDRIEMIVEPLGHRYQNGSCTLCGEAENSGDEQPEDLPGDVSGDGKINILDVVKIYAHVKSVSTIINEAALKAADYTGDGKINIMDVAKLYAHVKGTN